MEDQLYPALYESADSASNKTQSSFVIVTKAYITLVVISIALSTFLPKTTWAAITLAAFLFVTMLAPLFMIFRKYSDTWYRARALAESIKTSTWKFMMRSEPFDALDGIAKPHFQDLLRRLLEEHRALGYALSGQTSIRQVTPLMVEVRESNLTARKSYYLKNRIDEQHKWYCGKASQNKSAARLWLLLMITLHSSAGFLALAQIGFPERNLPVELFVVLGSSALSWMQFKKFGELGAAYALTAQEISIAREGFSEISSEAEFSKAVADVENAFSREHTQWAARKDQQ